MLEVLICTGKKLRVTEIAVVDEIASAELVMGKLERVPVVVLEVTSIKSLKKNQYGLQANQAKREGSL